MSGEGIDSGGCVEFVLLVELLCVQKEECVCVCGCLVFLVGAFSGVWVWGGGCANGCVYRRRMTDCETLFF